MSVRGSYGPLRRQMEQGVVRVSIVSGAGSKAVSFRDAFLRPPSVLVPPYDADAGIVVPGSITKTGFTLTITGSDFADGEVDFPYVALENG